MTFVGELVQPDALRGAVETARQAAEAEVVHGLAGAARFNAYAARRVQEKARALVLEVRRAGVGHGGLDAFLHEYELSNQEGVVLMCLAEALLRIPDSETADRLIRDKLADADWEGHLGHSESLLVNAGTWALMLTGRIVAMDEAAGDVGGFVRRLAARSGEPVIRQALVQAMRIMAGQFIMGRTIEEALERAREGAARGYRHSFDMLGEAARTAEDAARYFDAYAGAIDAIGDVIGGPGVSVKLSALHSRFEMAQRRRVLAELAPRLAALAARARDAGVGLCVDAEEAKRLDLTLDVVEAVSGEPALAGWHGLGLAVQAYLRCAAPLIDWLAALAWRHGRRLMVRLVKGAYWDSEIKRGQEQGLDAYPVFTRKASTDVSYLACARRVLAAPDAFYPQFATHNAHTVAAVLELVGEGREFEFQRLHGMGEALYDQVVGPAAPCRVYAPVGGHEELLAYLVRRLLENGANTSFVNRIVDQALPVEAIVADPVARVGSLETVPHPRIPLPAAIFGAERRNARGLDLSDAAVLRELAVRMQAAGGDWRAAPLIGGAEGAGAGERPVLDPADGGRRVGTVVKAAPGDVEAASARAAAAAGDWDATPAEARAACLERAADMIEADMAGFMAVAVREAGRTIPNALAEVREAVDFCRYYGPRARADFAQAETMPGPTGETNRVALHGRGVFACISPWNFPLAIFVGQVGADLAAGNAVLAKPAGQTPLMASRAVAVLHRAGVPGDVLHLLPGDGPGVGAALVADQRIAGVAFTGSVATAHAVNRALAARPGPITTLIAETGGVNAMIVDSTALAEQVVADVVTSAFDSAGQRCSALRLLFVQGDVAGRIIAMLRGAMAELAIGDPGLIETDVGPVIDAPARRRLDDHARRMGRVGRLIHRAALPEACAAGTFFAPCAFAIDDAGGLGDEVFGPILHVVTFAGDRLDDVVAAIGRSGYGLTLGIHSRIEGRARRIQERLRMGNTYVNRNMIGAGVGVQPFGGEGLSGTGPKAGGRRYVRRFASERTMTVNTAAVGGNAALLSMDED